MHRQKHRDPGSRRSRQTQRRNRLRSPESLTEPGGTQGHVRSQEPGEGAGQGLFCCPVAKGHVEWPQMGCLAGQSLTGQGAVQLPEQRMGSTEEPGCEGVNPWACIPLNSFYSLPARAPPPPSSLYPKPWVFPLPPLLVTRPCFLPEIKGLSTEIPQEGGGGTQPLPRASLELSLPVPNLACPINTEVLN